MAEREAVVRLKAGLQARAAAMFVQEANRFSAEIFVEIEGKKISAKSIMGIMSLAIASGTTIKLVAEGSDAEEAVEALAQFVEKEE